MKIYLNAKEVEVLEGEILLETARRIGLSIPSLCYAKGAIHKSSCMVCVVKNETSGQMIPSCSTLPVEGMQIDTESEEVKKVRKLSLELLLSNHRADCEAPCKVVCPAGLDIPEMNRLYDQGMEDEALEMLRNTLVIPATLCYICGAPCEKVCRKGDLDQAVPIREIKKGLVALTDKETLRKPERNGKEIAVLGSDPAGLAAAFYLNNKGYQVTVFEKYADLLIPHIEASKVPPQVIALELEVLNRTGVGMIISGSYPDLSVYDGVISTVDENPFPEGRQPSGKSVLPARRIKEGRLLAEKMHASFLCLNEDEKEEEISFNSTYSHFGEEEKQYVLEQKTPHSGKSGCLYCNCQKKSDCKLRTYASEYGIKHPRYTKDKEEEAQKRKQLNDSLYFEPAKCIRCGLCVYNSSNGFTFKDRGYGMQVVLPVENNSNIKEELVELCPTGALYRIE